MYPHALKKIDTFSPETPQGSIAPHTAPGGRSNGSQHQFGRYRVVPGARQLLADGKPLGLGSRAFDILTVLLSARGAVVSKEEIIRAVWPSTIVDETNLRFQVAALRKALGKDRDVIKTIPGRGYLLAQEDDDIQALKRHPSLALVEQQPREISPGKWRAGMPAKKPGSVVPPTVVVINNDEDIREALQAVLRWSIVDVEYFASISSYEGCPRAFAPDCIILDIGMTGQSAMDFLTVHSTREKHIPIICLSDCADISFSVRAMKAGADEFFLKPVPRHDLMTAIAEALLAKD